MKLGLAAAAAAALLATGCGQDKTETVTQVVAPTQPVQTATTPPSNTLAEARATLRSRGYRVDDPSDYDPNATLGVLIGTRVDSGDGYAKRAFFFVDGEFIGTDTSDDSANIRVESATDDTVTLGYAIYRGDDPLCCPSDSAAVRYQWNGSRLVPLDSIPARSLRS